MKLEWTRQQNQHRYVMKTEGKILLGGGVAIALAIAIFGHDDSKPQTAQSQQLAQTKQSATCHPHYAAASDTHQPSPVVRRAAQRCAAAVPGTVHTIKKIVDWDRWHARGSDSRWDVAVELTNGREFYCYVQDHVSLIPDDVVDTTNPEPECQPDTKAKAAASPAPKPERDKVATLAVVMQQVLNKQGSDVLVGGTDDALLFDCSKALDPRVTCYELYQEFRRGRKEIAALLDAAGVHELMFKTDPSVWASMAWVLHR
jgi:hypothetical protein